MKLLNIITRKDKLFGIRKGCAPIYLGPAEYTGFTRTLPVNLLRDGRVRLSRHVGDWYCVVFKDYDSRLEWLRIHGDVEIFEADFSPTRRYMADHPEIAIDTDLRWASVDIETDPRIPVDQAIEGHARVISIAIYDKDGNEYQECLAEETDVAEAALLAWFHNTVDAYDLLAGWNSEEFDKLVLESRSKQYRLFPDRRIHWFDAMVAHKRMDVQGQDSGENKSAALNVVANAKLGFGKHDYDSSNVYEDWKAGGERRQRLLDYNRQDARLVTLILQKTGYLESFLSICETCRIFPNTHNLKPTPQIDGYLSSFVRSKNARLPTRKENPTITLEELEGAYVMDPASSVAEDVHVADFASLYPSIIRTLNMCWTTKDPSGSILVPDVGVRFRDDVEGLYPAFLAEMAEQRAVWKRKRALATPGTPEYWYADRRQIPPKTLSNSAYGVLANPYSRFHDLDLAKSVTAMGRWLIKLVMAEARSAGLVPVYGDTDSCMISGCTHDEFAAFVRRCNEIVFPRELKSIGCSRNFIQLDFVETFSKIVFCSAKRYAGRFSLYAGKPVSDYAIEIKGLEYRRGDANRLARLMQEEAVHMSLGGMSPIGSIVEWVQRWQRHVFDGHIDVDDIAIDKGVAAAYATHNKNGQRMSMPAQGRVAEILRERGKRPFRVSYVITNASVSPMEVIPAEDYDGEFDRHHLWNNVVYPPTLRLLAAAFPDCNWNHWLTRRVPKSKRPLEGQIGLF